MSSFILTDVLKVLTLFGTLQQPNLSEATSRYLKIGYATCWRMMADAGPQPLS